MVIIQVIILSLTPFELKQQKVNVVFNDLQPSFRNTSLTGDDLKPLKPMSEKRQHLSCFFLEHFVTENNYGTSDSCM